MRILTYNILNGGEASAASASRFERLLATMRDLDPDIIVLNEAKGFVESRLARTFAVENRLDKRAFVAEAQTGQHVLVLVPKLAVVKAVDVNTINFHHARLKVTLELRTGGTLDIVGTHLCPHGGLNRLAEAQRLANDARDDRYVVLAGDMNSLDPHHDHKAQIKSLPRRYRARHLLPGSDTEPDTRAIATLEFAGFVDIVRKLDPIRGNPTAPTIIDSGGDEFSQMRVDYIFATEPLASTASHFSVVRNSETATLSDHYPLWVDFDIEL